MSATAQSTPAHRKAKRPDVECLVEVAQQHFIATGGQWPQVSDVATQLRWSQARVVDTVEGCWHATSPQLTGFNAIRVRKSDLFVELVNVPDAVVDQARATQSA